MLLRGPGWAAWGGEGLLSLAPVGSSLQTPTVPVASPGSWSCHLRSRRRSAACPRTPSGASPGPEHACLSPEDRFLATSLGTASQQPLCRPVGHSCTLSVRSRSALRGETFQTLPWGTSPALRVAATPLLCPFCIP